MIRYSFSQIGPAEDLYMERWVLTTPFGAIRLHHILRSDAGGEVWHDHPFNFVSFILWGGYTERLFVPMDGGNETIKTYRAGSILFRRAVTAHRLELSAPAWTLVFTGPRIRLWGFWHRNDEGHVIWTDWKTYVASSPGQ